MAGELCERMGRPEQARMMYARAVEEDPMLSVAVVRLCMLTKTLPIGCKGLSKRVRMVLECAERDGSFIDARAMGAYPAPDKPVHATRHQVLDRDKRAAAEPGRGREEAAQKEAVGDLEGTKNKRKGEPELGACIASMAEAQEWCDAYFSDRGKMSEFLALVSRVCPRLHSASVPFDQRRRQHLDWCS